MKIRVHSRKDGFRRAGLVFGRQPVTLDAAELGEERLTALEAEPMLVVERLEEPDSEPEKGKNKDKGKGGE